MAEEKPDIEVAKVAITARLGSIIAAAGCGKTEQIANAALLCSGRRLILTHTHAGVDVLRKRLGKLGYLGTSTGLRQSRVGAFAMRHRFPEGPGFLNLILGKTANGIRSIKRQPVLLTAVP